MEKEKKRTNCIPVSVGIPSPLLDLIDEIVAKAHYKSRSSFIVNILEEKLQQN